MRSRLILNEAYARSKRGTRAVETQTRYTLYLIRTVGECSHCEHVVTLAGCSRSSSSSIQKSNFQHTLIKVPAIWDVVDKVPTKYNLDDLFTTLEFNDPRWSGVQYSGNATRGDKDVTAWVKSLIEHLQLNHGNVSYTADISIEAFKKELTPFLCSIDNRPDGVVLRSFKFDDIEWKLPVVIIEVHSSPYVNTLLQTAADVIDQLRLLRCFNANITECVGFTFPKYAGGNDIQNKSCVTKVCVSFENYQFNIQLFPLAIEEVKEEIEATLKKAMEFCAKRPFFAFIRLSDADIEIAGTILKDKVFQVESRFSILLANKTNNTYYKHVTSMSESRRVERMNAELSKVDVKHVTLYSDRLWIHHSLFYRYPAQLPPLPKDEVAQCLFDYMTMTAIALTELHDNGFAHLDVRIPNICFAKDYDGKYMVKLIDLDRCKNVTATTGSSYEGEMYRAPRGWTCDQLDWKQLGLLAAEIILEGISHEHIVCSSLAKEDTFFNKLLLQGMCIV